MRMVNGKLAASMGTWRETAAEMKDGKRKMTGFLNQDDQPCSVCSIRDMAGKCI